MGYFMHWISADNPFWRALGNITTLAYLWEIVSSAKAVAVVIAFLAALWARKEKASRPVFFLSFIVTFAVIFGIVTGTRYWLDRTQQKAPGVAVNAPQPPETINPNPPESIKPHKAKKAKKVIIPLSDNEAAPGGKAHAIGDKNLLLGGPGGHGGPGGKGGPGGDVSAEGNGNILMGGAAGDNGEYHRGGNGADSPYSILSPYDKYLSSFSPFAPIKISSPGTHIAYMPPGARGVKIMDCASGGGGGGGGNQVTGGGGGGSGGCKDIVIPLSPGAYVKTILGRGGFGGEKNQNGQDGEDNIEEIWEPAISSTTPTHIFRNSGGHGGQAAPASIP